MSMIRVLALLLAATSAATGPGAMAAPVAVAGPTASPATIADNAKLAATLNWDDTQDFDFASRGFVGTRADPIIRDQDGGIIRDLSEDAQFTGPAPATVNPSLWRNAVLLAKNGLFKVRDGIWQVRGFDLSNMTIIAGKTGWILVDPLTTAEVAAAALALVNERLGARPVTGVIYTHSHGDHFGGSAGVVAMADAMSGKVPVIAPAGFMTEAISENVIAGPAMTRRADYMFGWLLPRSTTGHVSSGLGPTRARGTVTLVPPNDSITKTGDTRTIDGVRFEFQLTPGTEAPSEMNFYLPEMNALCMAENANGAMHNLLTPRGALVRDARSWADFLLESRRHYAGQSDVMFTSHFWPRWGSDEIGRTLLLHAQAYAFVHNESVRMMNNGLNAVEIGEAITLPAPLARAWFNRPNYGSLKFNARAVYQRYLGAFDGDPVNLDPLPRTELAIRTVAAMGGAQKTRALAKAAAAQGDDRWAATLLGYLVRANPLDTKAKAALAQSFEQLAFRAEASPWRDFYLSGAKELRDGVQKPPQPAANTIASNLQVASLLDTMSVRVVPERASGAAFTIAFVIPDMNERHLVTIANGVMLHERGVTDKADATLVAPRLALIAMVGGRAKALDLLQAGTISIAGDPAALQRFLGLFEPPRAGFALVTP
jgi:alkyl sulfatase BDS1-like metallo-beta-lactamase superfamily hydrolase